PPALHSFPTRRSSDLLLSTMPVLSTYGEEGRQKKPVRIGMSGSLFRDMPEPLVRAVMQPFGTVMEAQTGVPGQIIPGGDPLTIRSEEHTSELQSLAYL